MGYWTDVPDHPVIRNLERTGWPDGKEPEYPHCPACSAEEASEVLVTRDGGVAGCEACMSRVDAEDHPAYAKPGAGPVCPVCGKPCEDAWIDKDGNPAGCDACVRYADAWDRKECFWPKEPY